MLFAMVWYDNILIVCDNESIRGRVGRHLGVLSREVGIVIKDPGLCLSRNEVEFLGIHIKRGGTTGSVEWRHVERNIERWKMAGDIQRKTCGRAIAEKIGLINWHLSASGERWLQHEWITEAVALLKPCYDGTVAWHEETIEIPERVLAGLRGAWCEALHPKWRHRNVECRNGPLIALPSDASDWGLGAVRLDDIRRHISRQWSEKERTFHINHKERKAAEEAMSLVTPEEWEVAQVVLFVDNVSAAAWLRNGQFGGACEIVESQIARTEVMVIRSEENPADGLSRGADEAPPELAATLLSRAHQRKKPWFWSPPSETNRERKKARREEERD